MQYNTLLFDVRDGVAYVTLNRPDASNGLEMEMGRELMDAAQRCDEDPDIRAILLSGAGSVFCVGGDLKNFATQGEHLPYHLKELTTYFHAAISRLARMDAPVVAAVHGVAAGGGFSLAISCDLVLAAESARFTMAYSKAGLTPDGSSTYFLPRLVGFRRAMELTLTGRVLSAQEASEWGIVNRVVPDDDLSAEAAELASQLASGPTKTLGASKRLLHTGWTETLETQMEHESQSIADAARTADAREGIAAFTEKRSASFEGR
ncbi:MAG: 2-(1,2-epoxy,2-dihydrophenyl)acetyl-CoA isomerase [Rubrobacteraceae bacterium]|nr:2-(1,2-epoxy,2-dihydrophenyl)acetyl-CoA isomerase [Rubrobacteraceae bacterium]